MTYSNFRGIPLFLGLSPSCVIYGWNTENAVKSNKTTGVFALVATCTDARSPLASAVEPRTVPESAYQRH